MPFQGRYYCRLCKTRVPDKDMSSHYFHCAGYLEKYTGQKRRTFKQWLLLQHQDWDDYGRDDVGSYGRDEGGNNT